MKTTQFCHKLGSNEIQAFETNLNSRFQNDNDGL